MRTALQNYLYLEVDISKFPCADLYVIDQLWVNYSGGKFGFSVQKQIWRECYNPTEYNSHWERFGNQVGWRQGLPFFKDWIWEVRVDEGGAIYDISAPRGHLPLPPKKSQDMERRSQALYIEAGAMIVAALSGMELGLGGKELWSGLRWVKETAHRLSECKI